MHFCSGEIHQIHHWNANFWYWNWFFVKVIKVVKLFNSFHCVSFLKVCFTFIFPHLFPYYFVWFRFTVSFRLGHRHPSFGRPTAKHMVKGKSKWRDSLSHTHVHSENSSSRLGAWTNTRKKRRKSMKIVPFYNLFCNKSQRHSLKSRFKENSNNKTLKASRKRNTWVWYREKRWRQK